MSEKIVVSCEQGHKFPVNLNKHRYRAEVYCPKCMSPVVVRAKLSFLPKPGWVEEKLKWAEERRAMKAARKRGGESPSVFMPAHAQNLGLLALSMLVKKREEEKAKGGQR